MGGFMILFCIALFKGTYGNSASCQDPAAYGCGGPPPEFHELLKTSTPDAEFLRRFCPDIKKLISCHADYAKACNQAETYSQFVSNYNLTVEMCDETSDLHKAYERNIECMWPLHDRDVTDCKERVKQQLLQYVEYRAKQDDIYQGLAEALRLKQYLVFRCYATEVQGSCNEEATATFWEIALRFQPGYPKDQVLDAGRQYDAMLNELQPEPVQDVLNLLEPDASQD